LPVNLDSEFQILSIILIMPRILGLLGYLASIAFGVALIWMLLHTSITGVESANPVVGYFGYGFGTLLLGGGTLYLWKGTKWLESLLGWSSSLASLAISASLLIMLTNFVDGKLVPGWQYVPAHLVAIFVFGLVGVSLARGD
jgi:hypothetical protein